MKRLLLMGTALLSIAPYASTMNRNLQDDSQQSKKDPVQQNFKTENSSEKITSEVIESSTNTLSPINNMKETESINHLDSFKNGNDIPPVDKSDAVSSTDKKYDDIISKINEEYTNAINLLALSKSADLRISTNTNLRTFCIKNFINLKKRCLQKGLSTNLDITHLNKKINEIMKTMIQIIEGQEFVKNPSKLESDISEWQHFINYIIIPRWTPLINDISALITKPYLDYTKISQKDFIETFNTLTNFSLSISKLFSVQKIKNSQPEKMFDFFLYNISDFLLNLRVENNDGCQIFRDEFKQKLDSLSNCKPIAIIQPYVEKKGFPNKEIALDYAGEMIIHAMSICTTGFTDYITSFILEPFTEHYPIEMLLCPADGQKSIIDVINQYIQQTNQNLVSYNEQINRFNTQINNLNEQIIGSNAPIIAYCQENEKRKMRSAIINMQSNLKNLETGKDQLEIRLKELEKFRNSINLLILSPNDADTILPEIKKQCNLQKNMYLDDEKQDNDLINLQQFIRNNIIPLLQKKYSEENFFTVLGATMKQLVEEEENLVNQLKNKTTEQKELQWQIKKLDVIFNEIDMKINDTIAVSELEKFIINELKKRHKKISVKAIKSFADIKGVLFDPKKSKKYFQNLLNNLEQEMNIDKSIVLGLKDFFKKIDPIIEIITNNSSWTELSDENQNLINDYLRDCWKCSEKLSLLMDCASCIFSDVKKTSLIENFKSLIGYASSMKKLKSWFFAKNSSTMDRSAYDSYFSKITSLVYDASALLLRSQIIDDARDETSVFPWDDILKNPLLYSSKNRVFSSLAMAIILPCLEKTFSENIDKTIFSNPIKERIKYFKTTDKKIFLDLIKGIIDYGKNNFQFEIFEKYIRPNIINLLTKCTLQEDDLINELTLCIEDEKSISNIIQKEYINARKHEKNQDNRLTVLKKAIDHVTKIHESIKKAIELCKEPFCYSTEEAEKEYIDYITQKYIEPIIPLLKAFKEIKEGLQKKLDSIIKHLDEQEENLIKQITNIEEDVLADVHGIQELLAQNNRFRAIRKYIESKTNDELLTNQTHEQPHETIINAAAVVTFIKTIEFNKIKGTCIPEVISLCKQDLRCFDKVAEDEYVRTVQKYVEQNIISPLQVYKGKREEFQAELESIIEQLIQERSNFIKNIEDEQIKKNLKPLLKQLKRFNTVIEYIKNRTQQLSLNQVNMVEQLHEITANTIATTLINTIGLNVIKYIHIPALITMWKKEIKYFDEISENEHIEKLKEYVKQNIISLLHTKYSEEEFQETLKFLIEQLVKEEEDLVNQWEKSTNITMMKWKELQWHIKSSDVIFNQINKEINGIKSNELEKSNIKELEKRHKKFVETDYQNSSQYQKNYARAATNKIEQLRIKEEKLDRIIDILNSQLYGLED